MKGHTEMGIVGSLIFWKSYISICSEEFAAFDPIMFIQIRCYAGHQFFGIGLHLKILVLVFSKPRLVIISSEVLEKFDAFLIDTWHLGDINESLTNNLRASLYNSGILKQVIWRSLLHCSCSYALWACWAGMFWMEFLIWVGRHLCNRCFMRL